MPSQTALEILKAYQEKKRLNPDAPRPTLFKYIVWDRFRDRMIMDEELEEMVTGSRNLQELTYKIIAREKAHLLENGLDTAVNDELSKFFDLNAPDEKLS